MLNKQIDKFYNRCRCFLNYFVFNSINFKLIFSFILCLYAIDILRARFFEFYSENMSLKINDDPHKIFDKHEYEGIHYCAYV